MPNHLAYMYVEIVAIPFSIENVNTQNNLNKFAVYTHFGEIRGNTKKLNKSVTEWRRD